MPYDAVQPWPPRIEYVQREPTRHVDEAGAPPGGDDQEPAPLPEPQPVQAPAPKSRAASPTSGTPVAVRAY